MMGAGKKSFKNNEEGVAAVEFALMAIPFIFLLIGIIEMALVFTSQSLLEASTAEAAREIRTGAVQQGGGEQAFIDEVCDFAAAMIPCEDIQYQVVSFDDFGDAEDFPDAEFDDEGNLEDQGFDPGGVNDVVMVRVAYTYPIKTPMMQMILTNNGDGNRIMLSTLVLQTEPYEFEDD
ncbi:MAG: pilus assembly protein [Alphaproteobacteria bacterium]|nr:pilus assembly protein [Alphaproteobacteria bacterium]